MRPPGSGASVEKVSTFRHHLHRTLEKGETVELAAWGVAASQNTMEAFATCSKAIEFQVKWQAKDSEKERCLHFTAKTFLPWEEYLQSRIMNTKSIPVQSETRAVALARSICSILQASPPESRALRVYTPLSDEAAMHVLAKGLATAPGLHPFKTLKCVCNVVTPIGDQISRLFAYLTFADDQALPDVNYKEFNAYPPSNPDQESQRRFATSVQDRLQMGYNVKMNCRGPAAVTHAIQSLCQMKGHTAQFRVNWDAADTINGSQGVSDSMGSSAARALRIQAVRGPSWAEFNSIDFSRTQLLFVNAKTPVGKLAYAIIAEVRQKEAVSLHGYSDSKDAVSVLIKALATVRSISGKQVSCVPSYGRAGAEDRPVLRVYVQRYKTGRSDAEPRNQKKVMLDVQRVRYSEIFLGTLHRLSQNPEFPTTSPQTQNLPECSRAFLRVSPCSRPLRLHLHSLGLECRKQLLVEPLSKNSEIFRTFSCRGLATFSAINTSLTCKLIKSAGFRIMLHVLEETAA